ncbi:MAG: MoxR family ATPase [Myxococcota bacterium]
MEVRIVDIEAVAREHRIIGRRTELRAVSACIAAGRNILLEGPVGVGKTALARAAAQGEGRGFFRVDGDGRYTENKLVGAFDPPGVLERGYQPDLFIEGPLTAAMKNGAVLFVNELNRMPEGVQNVLLPALDEGMIHIPHLGAVRAAPGFIVIATQNPSEFVATGHLSEALLDRFELVNLDYQSADEEQQIVRQDTRCAPTQSLIDAAVAMVRATREDPRIRRGASVRAAIAIADLAVHFDGDIAAAARLALPTRIELGGEREEISMERLIEDLQKKTFSPSTRTPRRKKTGLT